jgi:hypothetical protein
MNRAKGGFTTGCQAAISPPIVVGIEETGSMGWFLRSMEEVAIEGFNIA